MKDQFIEEMESYARETEARLESNVLNVTTYEQIEIDEVEKQARWMAKRCGKITVSIAPKLMTKGKKSDWGQIAIGELLAIFHERRTGIQRGSISTFAMRWGLENEYPAFCYYRDHFNPETIYSHDGNDILFLEPIPGFGISPDAMTYCKEIESDLIYSGITEIKCPENPVNHLKYCMIETVTEGEDYFWQMIAQFLSGVEWIDFCSFDPRMKDGDPLKMHVVRLYRKDYLDSIVRVEARIIEAGKFINDWNLLKYL